jgi:dTDP-4-dehydrorhamnose reductase
MTVVFRELRIMRIVVTGASGQLGSYLLGDLTRAGRHEVYGWSRATSGARCGVELRPVELTDLQALEAALEDARADVVIHTAAMSAADAVCRDQEKGWRVNVEGTKRLADWCVNHDCRLVFTSTDLVFDGTQGWYREDDEPSPILAYGRTKAAAERVVLEVPLGLVVRIGLLFGPSQAGRDSFFDRALARLREGQPQSFFEDEFRTPLDYATATRALVALAESETKGVVHLAGRERVSRHELMRRVAETLGLDSGLVCANRSKDFKLVEPRPADVSLDTAQLNSLLPELARPSIETAIRGLWG